MLKNIKVSALWRYISGPDWGEDAETTNPCHSAACKPAGVRFNQANWCEK